MVEHYWKLGKELQKAGWGHKDSAEGGRMMPVFGKSALPGHSKSLEDDQNPGALTADPDLFDIEPAGVKR